MGTVSKEERKEMEDSVAQQNKFIKQTDLYKILPFGKTKINQLIASGSLPLVKIGKDYLTTYSLLEQWVKEHIGEEIYY